MSRDSRQDPQPGDVLHDALSRVEVLAVGAVWVEGVREARGHRSHRGWTLDGWRMVMRSARVEGL